MEQYLDYLKEQNGVMLYKVTMSMMDRKSMISYLDYLEKEQGCSVSTRNHAEHVLGIFKVCSYGNIEAAGIWNEIQSVPKSSEAKKPVDYLTVKAVEAIIAQPDVTTRKGKRDAFLLLFLYQTGARVQELVDVRICDLAR